MIEPKNCNAKVLQDTIIATGESKKMIENIVSHQSKFIVARMKEGAMESVRIPSFGKFTVKMRELQWKNLLHGLPRNTKRKPKKNAPI